MPSLSRTRERRCAFTALEKSEFALGVRWTPLAEAQGFWPVISRQNALASSLSAVICSRSSRGLCSFSAILAIGFCDWAIFRIRASGSCTSELTPICNSMCQLGRAASSWATRSSKVLESVSHAYCSSLFSRALAHACEQRRHPSLVATHRAKILSKSLSISTTGWTVGASGFLLE